MENSNQATTVSILSIAIIGVITVVSAVHVCVIALSFNKRRAPSVRTPFGLTKRGVGRL